MTVRVDPASCGEGGWRLHLSLRMKWTWEVVCGGCGYTAGNTARMYNQYWACTINLQIVRLQQPSPHNPPPTFPFAHPRQPQPPKEKPRRHLSGARGIDRGGGGTRAAERGKGKGKGRGRQRGQRGEGSRSWKKGMATRPRGSEGEGNRDGL